MWMHICQGLVILGWLVRLTGNILLAWAGKDKQEPTGAAGIIITLIWSTLTAVVIWKSGAISTVLAP